MAKVPHRILLSPGEDDLAWGHFVLQAARGSFLAPGWAMSALLRSVSDKVGVPVDAIDHDHLTHALRLLPEDPTTLIAQLGELAGVGVPPLDGPPRLGDDVVIGLQRTPVASVDLLHDSFLVLLRSYGSDGLLAAIEGISEPRQYDARAAVVVMLYALLLAKK